LAQNHRISWFTLSDGDMILPGLTKYSRRLEVRGLCMASSVAVEYLASAYERMGYKAVAMALRKHGPNADKFKVEVAAIEAAICGTHEADASIADGLDSTGEIGRAIRQMVKTGIAQMA
jgi:hypothetical protein